ncbi:MAG: ATP-grasp domain-containing protein [Gammaproteobacteria bacterium]|jgi:carbamoylphosphate synthase large subunit
MNVIFIEPAFPDNQRQFARALKKVGARVIGVGERPWEWLDDELRGWLDEYEHVPSVTHEGVLMDTVRKVQSRHWVDRLEATIEAHILPVARIREACHIPGTSVHTAWLCRDKPSMKEALRTAGVPCARSAGTDDPDAARDFAARVGYPLIIKPRDSAGAAATWRVDDDGELEQVIRESGLANGANVALEEFVEGHEGYYDTITVNGRIAHDFVTHYYPNVLEAMRNRWISPQMVTTNRLDAPGYDEIRAMGRKVIETLGIGTSATHMEWFFGPRGLRFSEIGCRPPGVCQWDVYCAANDFDLYEDWANAIVHGRTWLTPSRRYSAGMIALRPDRDGHIRGYEGVEDIQKRFGEWIVASRFPDPGAPTQGVEAGYMANAWIRIRHPDYDHLRWMMDEIGRTIKVHAG